MEPGPPEPGHPHGWRLAGSSSAYLRAASEQPIDWHPWGNEAFDVARRSGRPILLDIGASWCHWCHVMDEGTYSDAEVARLLGEHFVAIKVDRDEHPEIDRRYQRQVGALTGEGGWPLTGFLTPDGEVFLGGTYYPPTDGHGRPGFRRLLAEIARLWKEEPDQLHRHAQSIRDALERMRSTRPAPGRSLEGFISGILAQVHQGYDPVNGGFGFAPKFPHPTAVSLLLWEEYSRRTPVSGERARENLQRMADGGIYDQIGGGFHRYSVDEAWHIPHFEKMASDNAALLAAYVEGAQRFADPRFEQVIGGIVNWVRTTLLDPEGGFGASQDADNAPGDDGSFYTWTRAEMRGALEEAEFKVASRFFGAGSDGRMPEDPQRNVLFRLMPIAEVASNLGVSESSARATLERSIEKLRAARARRPQPIVDRARHADLNGAMAFAFARAGEFLGDVGIVNDARAAVDRILEGAYRPGRGVAHQIEPTGPSGFGLLDDQVQIARALTELAGVMGEPRYAGHADEILSLIDREFRGEDGLLRDLVPGLHDGPTIGSLQDPSYPLEDSPHLAANSSAALTFLRYSALVHDDRWREKAAALLLPISSRIGGAGIFGAGAAWAAGLLQTPAVTIVVEGSGPEADELERIARRTWHPNRWVFRGTPPPPFSPPGLTRAGTGAVRALVCVGTSCLAPITDGAALSETIGKAGRSSGG
ncbi:MAG: thioredoxin domain-containing protein [Thermoplasmata archaeon]|nr:thioredoxin domain-containing protein [Thermoplasmata archaeon]